ncbi:hypothetical protein PVA45_03295 [Entomospira entomophila]|uniref:Alginate export domain-containing protein n=1 Tax=Entomospira entomophila TaxID=2719988 RepID=A0A968GCP7_9SPIO|nr:hypothetical protein [Entomospira entomophilus]NIZ40539.1 hypothetical protein [Entomospira entomophilus]WDI36097.1 hypothetical protein PVA45_03295 [Entomospira entomophilus]
MLRRRLLPIIASVLLLTGMAVFAQEVDEDEEEIDSSTTEPAPAVKPTFTHAFSLTAAVDVRSWTGPRLSGPGSLFGVNGKKGDLFAGAKLESSYIGFNYSYGPYAGATIQLGFRGEVGAIANDNPNSVSIGLRRAFGWVDPLGLLGVNKYVGLKITAGYLHYEAWEGLNSPDWQGGPATAFEMGTSALMSRAIQNDVLALRLDLPVNVVRSFKLNFAVLTDLDFSRANNGWSFMGEVTAKDIRFGMWGQMGVNAHYHHWQGGDDFDQEKTHTKVMAGQGFYGSHLVGASANIKFFLPAKTSITLGFVGDYQWYFGNHKINRYDDYDMNETGAPVLFSDYGHRKGSFAFETGVNISHPWIVLNLAYVSRVTGSYGWSYDESKFGRRPNSFLSARLDLKMLEELTNLVFYGGFSVGVLEARKGFWEQVGRIGLEVGVQYRPTNKITIKTGWHMGSNFLGSIAAPGPKSRDGQFYLRFVWSMNTW